MDEPIANQLQSYARHALANDFQQGLNRFQTLQRAGRTDPDQIRGIAAVFSDRVVGDIDARRNHPCRSRPARQRMLGKVAIANDDRIRGSNHRPESPGAFAARESLLRVRISQPKSIVDIEPEPSHPPTKQRDLRSRQQFTLQDHSVGIAKRPPERQPFPPTPRQCVKFQRVPGRS